MQLCMNVSHGREEEKTVYLNFYHLSREQSSKRACVYCKKRTCRLYVGAYGVGDRCLFCVCERHLSPSNGLDDLWLL